MALGEPAESEPTREAIEAFRGPLVLEFGTRWCGFCRAAQPLLAAAFASYPGVERLQVEDGSGRPLGRSFRVKLWPTLVFLKDGKEVSRTVRPRTEDEVRRGLEAITAAQ
ncbi:MAG: thioredoxin 1 [Candidatus Binatota bacterium]|nr:thioredoxin 1 [Candidatus Binatota bacterium]